MWKQNKKYQQLKYEMEIKREKAFFFFLISPLTRYEQET